MVIFNILLKWKLAMDQPSMMRFELIAEFVTQAAPSW